LYVVVVVDVVGVVVVRANFVTVSCCSTSLLLLLLISLFLVAMASRFHVADHLFHLPLSSCIASHGCQFPKYKKGQIWP
jgi:hypothetical protein